ncbi:uncharacterized protein B0I36DRAFT_366687 [Microdochium trichocladiopsis]|uniref:NAD(P)-binding domain-containing protein n=1 Tax=Microdochium trichocladiopsis TaxID=1682393 RepID=A0A9P9BJ01_9PEZI|nr:uncharacterized protein B0I36DRAFT_366687 [Microdochium trichocladiopsis]KAH7024773.1 hypothetical protein B0I36DRAFT_366687 [Microdochium trichocladiopsis]
MSTFTNVALLGKGYLGSAILTELVEAGFNVTLLSRSESAKEGLPGSVKFTIVDYTSLDALVAALRGQDVVVSTVSGGGLLAQTTAIDASIKAGVKRYIPSYWGSFTIDPKARNDLADLHGPIFDAQKYVTEKARAGEIEYTMFSVGSFTDYFTERPFAAFDFDDKSVELFDGGKHSFSSTSIAGIGKAVVGALRNAEATKNRHLKVHEVVLSQAQLLALAKKYSPAGTQWKETNLDGKAEFDKALKAVLEDPSDKYKIIKVMLTGLMGGRYKTVYDEVDNELVGLPFVTEEDIESKLASALRS